MYANQPPLILMKWHPACGDLFSYYNNTLALSVYGTDIQFSICLTFCLFLIYHYQRHLLEDFSTEEPDAKEKNSSITQGYNFHIVNIYNQYLEGSIESNETGNLKSQEAEERKSQEKQPRKLDGDACFVFSDRV